MCAWIRHRHSLGAEELEKSVVVLKPGGRLITLSGPPDPEFARNEGMPKLLQPIVGLLNCKIRKKAGQRQVGYSFLFMRGSGEQLSTLGELIDSGVIRPIIDKVFPFEETDSALAYVEAGRARGKVVCRLLLPTIGSKDANHASSGRRFSRSQISADTHEPMTNRPLVLIAGSASGNRHGRLRGQ